MPKARGRDIDEQLLDMEEEENAWEPDSADLVLDLNPATGKFEFRRREVDDCDVVDPAIWPPLMKWIKENQSKDDKDEDDIPPIV